MFLYVVWNVSPEVMPLGPLSLRWYGLLFAAAFMTGYWVAVRYFKLDRRFGEKFLDNLLLYVIAGTVIGARLGHVLFYDFSYYKNHPLEIIAVWKGGLASHGAAIGLLIAMYLYARKTKVSLWVLLDILAVTVALGGAFIRTGNLMNSEIYGHATHSRYGFIYVHDAVESIKKDRWVTRVSFDKIKCDSMIAGQYVPLQMNLHFEKGFTDTAAMKQYAAAVMKTVLLPGPEKELVAMPGAVPVLKGPVPDRRYYQAVIPVLGIPKHPTHIYEAGFCVLLFLFLMGLYFRKKHTLKEGTLVGWFFFLLFTFRFLIEFIKNIQSDFEKTMTLNMGQLLSIPFILLGIGILIYVKKFGKKSSLSEE